MNSTLKNKKSEKPSDSKSTLEALDIALLAQHTAIGERALDVRSLDVRELTDIADYLVIASGTSNRHASNVAEKIRLALKDQHEEPLLVTSKNAPEWVILDYGNVVVHVFYEATRHYYQIDELWEKAPVLSVAPELEEVARGLRTGIYKF